MNSIAEKTNKGRGKQKEPTLVHVNVRLPEYVVSYFKTYENYTSVMRTVLTQYVDNKVSVRPSR